MLVLHRLNDTNEPKDDVSLFQYLLFICINVHSIVPNCIRLFSLSSTLQLDWQQFVTNKLWAWEQMNLQWAKNFTGDVQIVYYDDLVDNVDGMLRSILKFIDFPINEVI